MECHLLLTGGMNVPLDVFEYENVQKALMAGDTTYAITFKDRANVEYTVALKCIIGISKEFPALKL
jgi:hypothetical protein